MMKKFTLFFIPILFFSFLCSAQAVDSGKLSKTTQGIALPSNFLDFKLSGSIYLFDYLPVKTPSGNDFSIYAFILKVDAATKEGTFGLHTETRIRDSKLRPFYNSNIWFQEAYAFARTNWCEVHVGKFYRKVGFLWDGSFFGNVQYFNGLKLNPEFGIELVGNKPLSKKISLDYSLQFITNNDHVDGSLAGRDVESDTNASFKNGITFRVAPTFILSEQTKLTLGVSALQGQISRVLGGNFNMTQFTGEANLIVGKAGLLAEYSRVKGIAFDKNLSNTRLGYDNSNYYFASVRYQLCKKWLARVSYSQVDYIGGKATESEMLPGLVYSVNNNLYVLAEYNYWITKPNGVANQVIDNSLNFVVHYGF